MEELTSVETKQTKKTANIPRLPMDFFRRTAREWHHFHEMIHPPGGSDGKESACNTGDLGSIPGLGRSLDQGMATTLVFMPGEFHGQRNIVHDVLKSKTQLSR